MEHSKTYINDKECRDCKKVLPYTSYHNKVTDNKLYKTHICKKCSVKRMTQYRKLNPASRLLYSIRARAKRNGYKTDVELSDIIIPERCPVLGIPIFTEFSKRSENTPSVDRIDNDKGYTKDNIIVVSWRANRMKNGFSIDELEKVVSFYRELEE